MTGVTNESFAQATDLSGRLVRATNFALDHWWIWPLALLALWLVLKVRAQHGLLGRLDERADAAFGDIDALISERHALIGNLVEIVRAFAAQERAVISDVLSTHVEALEAMAKGTRASDTQIATSLHNVFSATERYPELACEDHYRGLRTDLIRIEDRITAARKFYNLAVEEVNGVRRAFPANMMSAAKSPPREKFSLGERREQMAEPIQISL